MEAASSHRNDLEVQFFGLRRSGNHGVIAWIAQQYEAPIVFLNDVEPFEDPFTTFSLGKIPNAMPERRLAPDATAKLRAARKTLLLISYEDLKLQTLDGADILPKRSEWLGESRQVRRVLLLRDFYNWLASRIKLIEKRSGGGVDLARRTRSMIRMWLAYAREFSGETVQLGEGLERISYGRWVSDESYAATVLERLGVPLLNIARSVVPKTGGGSSFGGEEADVKGLFERWKYLLVPDYDGVRAVVADFRKEIDAHNQNIFGFGNPF
ncbi:MAG TPA: hypothetical protein VMF58_02340 [Rhizomicrobium sp.]|nr:hypothetical protein [Rhizomicrobium sp.]